MLCTKCGQEYEGSQCPRCDGPVILVAGFEREVCFF